MPGKTRSYSSPRREAGARRTREQILTAAHDAFVKHGYAATLRQVASGAGVSRASVELAFGTKANLLDAVVDIALAGDDEPVPILQRPWVGELALRPPAEFLRGAATAFAAGAARVAPVLRALDQGAAHDDQLSRLNTRLTGQREIMARWLVDQVARRDQLARDLTVDSALEDVLVLLDPLVHRRLLLERHWSPDHLGAWLGRAFTRLLLDP